MSQALIVLGFVLFAAVAPKVSVGAVLPCALLAGDLARLQVCRRLWNAFPGISPQIAENLIEELLTP